VDAVSGIQAIRARATAIDPFRADLLVAAGFLVAAVIEMQLLTDEGSRAVTTAAAVLAMACLAVRRRHPLACAVAFAAIGFAQAFADGFLFTNSTAPFIALLLVLYSIGRYAQGRRFWAAYLVLLVGIPIMLMVESGDTPIEDFFWAVFLFSLPALAGRALRSRVLLQRELREKAEIAECEREARAQAAVADERARIAAELQAVVANGVSAMVVQAEAVPVLVGSGETPRAAQALTLIEETGRDALAEMRRLLGVLRREGDSPELAPQPTLSRAHTLVERARDGGLEVAMRVDGRPRTLPAGVDLAAYRVVQEALAAAADGGAASADVTVRYGERDVEVEVADDRAGGTALDGAALLAMRERIGLYGGVLRAGRRHDGAGVRVAARLPSAEDGS
jgi:signal transduction histidine kinase